MIAHEFDYTAPTQLKEALALLADGAKPLAGGMSLVPMMKLRLAVPEHVVDIRRIKELNYVKVSPDGIRLGATLSHHQVESSEIIRGVCPLLSKAAASIGDVQVRNMGTLGGSVAHADPAADYLAALFALEAQVKLTSSSGERIVAIREFVTDPFTTSIEPGELLTEIIVPAERPGTGTAYVKMAQPASGFALVGVPFESGNRRRARLIWRVSASPASARQRTGRIRSNRVSRVQPAVPKTSRLRPRMQQTASTLARI